MNRKVSRRVLARTVAEKLLAEPTRTKHWLRVLAAYMTTHNLVDDIDVLLGDIAHELYAQGQHLIVDVRAARPLSDTVRSELKHYLQKLTNAKTIAMTESVDPELVGGLVARTPDAELDLSIRSQLRHLANITAVSMTKET